VRYNRASVRGITPRGCLQARHHFERGHYVNRFTTMRSLGEPGIRELQASGHTSHNAIAGQLNARKVATARGGRWTHVQVRQILDRATVVAEKRMPQ
jgi:Recombinase